MTLAATTGPCQARMAGTAKHVVLPLWVGPTTTSDWAVSAATMASRDAAREPPEHQTTRRGRVGPEGQDPQLAPTGPTCAPPVRPGPAGRRRTPPRTSPATERAAQSDRSTTASMPATPLPTYPPWRRRCRPWRAPANSTDAGPRRSAGPPSTARRPAASWGSRSDSVEDRESRLGRHLELARRLGVDHSGLGVSQQPLSQRHLL